MFGYVFELKKKATYCIRGILAIILRLMTATLMQGAIQNWKFFSFTGIYRMMRNERKQTEWFWQFLLGFEQCEFNRYLR